MRLAPVLPSSVRRRIRCALSPSLPTSISTLSTLDLEALMRPKFPAHRNFFRDGFASWRYGLFSPNPKFFKKECDFHWAYSVMCERFYPQVPGRWIRDHGVLVINDCSPFCFLGDLSMLPSLALGAESPMF